jgi:hypothetical protein
MPTLDEIAARIDDLVTKYMGILEIDGDRPSVKLRSNLGSKWLGRSTWSSKRPNTTILELQQSILGDDRTLERVIAHEMIHHRDALAISAHDIALMNIGIKPESHGASFCEGAARINAVMGPGFVTELSDKEYAHTSSFKKFFVLITPLMGGKRLGWAWAARLSDQAKPWVDGQIAQGSRLVQTTDDRWARGAKIKRFGGYSIPRSGEDAALLQALYQSA